jgi:hypothetical protein
MQQKSVVMTAAWVEIVAGAAILAMLGTACRLLFATAPEGMSRPIGRLAGIALVALGVASLPFRSAGLQRRAVQGLVVYNMGATILLAWVAIATAFRGVLLWPAVILHAVIAAALIASSF